jgi:DNA mismatch repair protein MutS
MRAELGESLAIFDLLSPGPSRPAGSRPAVTRQGDTEQRGFDARDHARDLHLDKIVSAITGGRDERDTLETWYFARTRDVATVQHRHDVFRDLEEPNLWVALREVAASLGEVVSHLTQARAMRVVQQRQAWTLDAAAIYCATVRKLTEELRGASLGSRGLQDFLRYLEAYARSEVFTRLETETAECKDALAGVSYCVQIDGGRVTVRRASGEADYSEEIQSVFERFRQGAVSSYLIDYRVWPGMTRVGERILALVVKLFPDEFALLGAHYERHAGFLDPGVHRFFRELQFYVSYREHIDPIRAAGLAFCYPEVDAQSKEELAEDTFDLDLASVLLADGKTVVTNGFRLDARERIFVVSGPNQGGKTTFARTFGQLHHLAAIGVPVPGRRARLFLCDRIFTHFERAEDLASLTGKLETDLVEMQRTLRSATPHSVVVMNEVFSSTSLEDARFLGTEAMRRLVDLDCLAVYVTFVDELASFAPSVVSMISMVVPEDPATRTFKVVRGPANGLAHALSLAQKHRVTYEQLLERIS